MVIWRDISCSVSERTLENTEHLWKKEQEEKRKCDDMTSFFQALFLACGESHLGPIKCFISFFLNSSFCTVFFHYHLPSISSTTSIHIPPDPQRNHHTVVRIHPPTSQPSAQSCQPAFYEPASICLPVQFLH